jgi:hypothetical protein
LQPLDLSAPDAGNQTQVILGVPSLVAMIAVVAQPAMGNRIRGHVGGFVQGAEKPPADCAKAYAVKSRQR